MSMNVTGSMISPLSAGPLTAFPTGTDASDSSSGGGFGDVLKNAINQVQGLQGSADQQVNTLLSGGSADMSKVMISVEKADVAFQLMMQVRNKIVSAYQDIEKMQF